MEGGQVVDERLAQAPGDDRAELETGRRLFAQNDSTAALHDVERSPQNRLVVAMEVRPWRQRIDLVESVEDAILAPHVVGGLDPVAERRPAQHELEVAGAQQVGQVREATRELLDLQSLGDLRQVLA